MTEEVRRRALGLLDDSADPRVREALRVGEITLARDVSSWEGSGGSHAGHAVLLGLPARLLGAMSARPALREELEATFAQAVAEGPRESMVDLVLRWSRVEGAASAYRGMLRPRGEAFSLAVFEFLWGAGEEGFAEELTDACQLRDGDDGTTHVDVTCSLDDAAHARLRSVVEALIGTGASEPRRFVIDRRSGPG